MVMIFGRFLLFSLLTLCLVRPRRVCVDDVIFSVCIEDVNLHILPTYNQSLSAHSSVKWYSFKFSNTPVPGFDCFLFPINVSPQNGHGLSSIVSLLFCPLSAICFRLIIRAFAQIAVFKTAGMLVYTWLFIQYFFIHCQQLPFSFSLRRQPQDCERPLFRLLPSTTVLAPQSHIHSHVTALLSSAGDT